VINYLVGMCVVVVLAANAYAKEQKPGVERWAIKTSIAKSLPAPYFLTMRTLAMRRVGKRACMPLRSGRFTR